MAMTSFLLDDDINWSRVFRAAARNKLGIDLEKEPLAKKTIYEILEDLENAVRSLSTRVTSLESAINPEFTDVNYKGE